MKCQFLVGQKVAYVGTRPGFVMMVESSERVTRHLMLNVGDIYTVTSITPDQHWILLTLRERPEWCAYDYRAFRPLESTRSETDISVFTKLLDSKQLELEDA